MTGASSPSLRIELRLEATVTQRLPPLRRFRIPNQSAMSSEIDNPFDLDVIIAQRFESFPQSLFGLQESERDAEDQEPSPALPDEALEPQSWLLTTHRQADPVTALDRRLEENASERAPFDDSLDLKITGSHELLTRLGPITFDGSALLCRCPDCDAPMSIRLWLGLADCWRCPASIVLDELVVQRIAAEVERKEIELPAPPPTPIEFFGRPALPTVAPQFDTGAAPKVNEFEAQFSEELDQLTRSSIFAKWLRRIFRITPASVSYTHLTLPTICSV